MAQTTNVGHMSAWSLARSRGYTGTKEEFAELMASYATVAQQAQASATSAGQSASDASGSAQTASTASTAAQQAQTAAETAQASAQGYAQSAQASAQSAQGYAQSAESAKDTAVNAVDGFASGAQQALDSVNSAGNNWKSLAQAKALDSEAYALGTRDGADVGSSDETYHNNAKWYALTAATDATTASQAAQTATTKAVEAAQSASAAAESARTLTIDSTLTQSGQAADAKVTGDKISDLKEDLSKIVNDEGLAIYATKWGLSSNKWYKYGYNTAWIIPVRAGDVVTLKRSGNSYYTVFKTITNQGNGNVPDYATGFSGIVSYSTPQAQVTIPSDGAYLWLYIYNGTTSTAPTVFTINGLDMLKSLRQNLEALVATDATNTENIATNTADIATLDTRMDLADPVLAESRKYANLKNELANGDYHTAGSPMLTSNCTLSVNNNILTVTGDGTAENFDASEYLYITNLSLHHYFVGLWVKSNNDNCDRITLRIAGGYGDVNIYRPVKDKWYYVANHYTGVATGNTASAYSIRAVYADATTQNGKSISVKQATMLYTNIDFGLGVDPPLYKLLWIMQNNAFWTGTQTVTIWEKEVVNALTKQKTSFGQKRRPIVSFVDDDGYERAFAQYSPLSEKYNVPFTLAVSINSTIKDWQGLYAQSELGWEIAAHPSDGNLADKSTEAEIETVMVDTNAYLNAHGYKWSNIVYANGEPDERVRRIAKKYYGCGVCGSNAIVNRGVIANFEIQRIPIGYPMEDTWNTLENFKSLVDDAIANNGWCVFMTHAGMTEAHPATLTETMDQLIDYIINDCGVEIMTLNDGFEVFGNALETGDFLGENARQGGDKTTGIAVAKNGMLGNVIGVKSMSNLLTTLGQALGGTFATSCDPDTGEYTYTFTQT